MFEAEIKETGPVSVAYLSMHGPYDQTPEAYGVLYGWIAQHGMQPSQEEMPSAAYFTSPEEAPEDQAEWELRAPIAGEPMPSPPDESGVGVKRLEPTAVASTMHKGPYDSVGGSYEALVQWMTGHGYVPAGPPEEHYYSDPDEVPPEEYLTEIRFPVQKAQ
jgi:effector-binding domain-containing protein